MFPNVDHEALSKKWCEIEKKPFDIFRVSLDRRFDAYHRDATLHNMLTFVKLFPVHRTKFQQSVNALIAFSNVRLNLV